jgi:hypothetical protein
VRPRALGRFGLSRRLPRERITEDGNRSKEPRGPSVVADRRANLGDERVERGVGDEGVGPQEVVQLLARDRLRPPLEENFQQPEGLGRDVD